MRMSNRAAMQPGEPVAEPVAWMWEQFVGDPEGNQDDWATCVSLELPRVRRLHRNLRPLYLASPPLPSREAIAEIIYDAFPLHSTRQAIEKPEWVPGGNSFMQDDARRAADAILSLLKERA